MRRQRDLPYMEGDWFAVPLARAGYGIGRVARLNGGGIALGYFFDVKISHVPLIAQLDAFKPRDAVFVTQFGDLHLLNGRWHRVGHADWQRERWPVPLFGRVDDINKVGSRVIYSDALQELGEEQCSESEARALPFDGVSGGDAVEIVLNAIVSGKVSTYLQANLDACRHFLNSLK